MPKDSDSRYRATQPPMPGWVKALLVLGTILIVGVLVLHLTGNGMFQHGA